MSNTLDLVIDSNDAEFSVGNTEFSVFFENRTFQAVSGIIVKEFFSYNTYYNISSPYNTLRITYELASAPGSINTIIVTIPEGHYSVSDFRTALESAIQTGGLGGTFTITDNTLTRKFIFKDTNASIINQTFHFQDEGAYHVRRFCGASSSPFTLNGVNDTSIQNIYNASGETGLRLRCEPISVSVYDTERRANNDTILCIPSENFGDMIHYNDTGGENYLPFEYALNISRLNFRIEDLNGFLLKSNTETPTVIKLKLVFE